ncbi:MAG: acyltransferase family protein [Paludibacter sp.]|nr:acyltransferase family protein [Paludibacter sp.]
MVSENRIYSFDTVKCIAAFLVVSLHTPTLPIPILPECMVDIARFAVPFFLMISGYFIFSVDSTKSVNSIKKSIRKSLNLLLISVIIYFIVDLFSFQDFIYLKEQFLFIFSIEFWFFGKVPFSPVSWYLVAYIYSLLLYLLILKLKLKNKSIVLLIIICLLIWLITGSYQSLFFEKSIPLEYNTSWIMAFPFFLIGTLLKKNELRVQNLNINNIFLILLISFFCFTSIMAHIILKKITNHAVNGTGYLSTILLVITIFVYLSRNKNIGKGTIINNIGKEYSMYIFIFHVAFNYILCRLCLVRFDFKNISLIEPLISFPFKYQFLINNVTIFIITLLFSVILTKTKINTKIGI